MYTLKPNSSKRIQQRYPNDQQGQNIINDFSQNNDPFKSKWRQELKYSYS